MWGQKCGDRRIVPRFALPEFSPFIRFHWRHPLDLAREKTTRCEKGLRENRRRTSPRDASQELHHAGLERLTDEHRFLLTRERPAVVEVVAWAAGNSDRSENADYQYGKRRLRQIDGRIRFLTKRIEAAEVPNPQKAKAARTGGLGSRKFPLTG
jgi:hypothetical protein